MIKQILGILLIGTSILDSIKYTIQARKIQKEQTAKSMSRRFINFALLNDLVKLTYGIFIIDYFIIFSSILALICMIHLWWNIYIFYDYKHYPREINIIIQRPNMFVYLWNSILPNQKRKHL
jgi:lipid-A-disaccharide synthase-like uncharacterized protein